MRWEAWIIASLWLANIVLAPGTVGQEKKPNTAAVATGVAILSIVLLWLTIRLGVTP